MLEFLIGLLASISSVFTNGANKPDVAPPLNTAIIAYQETYYVPAVADLGNFPYAKAVKFAAVEEPKQETKPATPVPVPQPTPPPPAPVLPPTPAGDPYLAIPEPITSWLSMNLTLKGASSEGDRTLPEITFDREYWKIQVTYYWAPNVIPPKPAVQNDYFKLEVYEKGTNKLIYTMASVMDDTGYPKVQSFRKPGIYYFKVYTKDPSQWEITFWVSPKIAQ